jgi:glycosyltransferase involved in cell wall biosynthesis
VHSGALTLTAATRPPRSNAARLRIALVGDGESPHLLKWARALAPQVELWVASSRGFAPGFEALVPSWRRLALGGHSAHGGGNIGLLKTLPTLARWLHQVNADWINAHYLTSHGTLAWAARRGWRLRARLLGSAWGSDILVTPQRHAAYRWLTRRVLQACDLATSDSQHMAQAMRELGAGEVHVLPFGLEHMPPPPPAKQPWLFFANRGLEPIYRPQAVIELFATIAARRPEARLVVANDGSLRPALQARVAALGLNERVDFTGRLQSAEQDRLYASAPWYLSLPESDSVAVSVLEALAHGCVPLLSDLPANHELVRSGENGLIIDEALLARLLARPAAGAAGPAEAASGADIAALDALDAQLQALAGRGPEIAHTNRAWVQAHGMFAPAVAALLARLREIT